MRGTLCGVFRYILKLYFSSILDYTFALNEYDKKWYEFDDRNVKEINNENICVIYFNIVIDF